VAGDCQFQSQEAFTQLGYAADQPKTKLRKPLTDPVSFERWRHTDRPAWRFRTFRRKEPFQDSVLPANFWQ